MTLEMIEQIIISGGATSAVAVVLMGIVAVVMDWDTREQIGWIKLYSVVGGMFLMGFLLCLVLYVLLQGAKLGA